MPTDCETRTAREILALPESCWGEPTGGFTPEMVVVFLVLSAIWAFVAFVLYLTTDH